MELIVLSQKEEKELESLEITIQKNLTSFYEIGMALMRIRDERLYRKDYPTFEDYCRKRWQFSRRYANDLVASTRVIENLSGNNCSQIPKTESQARPLTKLPPEKQPEAWDRAVKTAPEGKVTARHVEEVVESMVDEDAPEEVKSIFVRRPDTCAFNFSSVAIRQLERIPLDDPERSAALDSVERWIKKNR